MGPILKRTNGLSSTEKVEIPSHRDGTKSLKPEREREKTGLGIGSCLSALGVRTSEGLISQQLGVS